MNISKEKYFEKLIDRILKSKTYVMIKKTELEDHDVKIEEIRYFFESQEWMVDIKETPEYYKISENKKIAKYRRVNV